MFLSVISSRLVCLLNGLVCKRIGLLERDIFIFMNEKFICYQNQVAWMTSGVVECLG